MSEKQEYKKKLIEVALPLDVINKASSKELVWLIVIRVLKNTSQK